jgi:mono/diheme cytochrome c family protein
VGSLAWNHVPVLAARDEAQRLAARDLEPRDAANLFAYFAASRYFERPGDAQRGKQIFRMRRCGECHGLSSADPGRAGPVTGWRFLGDPVAFAQQVWNRSTRMRQLCRQMGIPWPALNSQELTDLLLYLRNLPQVRPVSVQLRLASAQAGRDFFRLKGCAGCHTGRLSMEGRSRRTLTDFAAAIWGHTARVGDDRALLTKEEMEALGGYLWSVGYFDFRGDSQRGKRLFTKKRCTSCHDGRAADPPGPEALASRREVSPISAAAAAWRRGSTMLAALQQKGLAWPRLRGSELADLDAYLSPSTGN